MLALRSLNKKKQKNKIKSQKLKFKIKENFFTDI
jgi:hypothetical protein